MHIGDGFLPAPLWAGGLAVSGAAAVAVLRRFDERRIPRIALLTSVFFVASSIRVPLPPGSLHLLLNGLVGVVLGWEAIPAILLALFLQAILLGHGGLTTVGINTLTMGGGALAAHLCFQLRRCVRPSALREPLLGLAASLCALLVSGGLYFLVLVAVDPGYRSTASVDLVAHTPLLVIEPLLTFATVSFLARVKPELLGGTGVKS